MAMDSLSRSMNIKKEATLLSGFSPCWRYLSFRAVSSQVLSAASVLTIVFGMGTGVTPTRIATGIFNFLNL